jgi:hypothetical protein
MFPEVGSKAEMGPEKVCSGEGFLCEAARRRSVWCLVQESRRETVVGEDKLNEVKSKIRGGFFSTCSTPFLPTANVRRMNYAG